MSRTIPARLSETARNVAWRQPEDIFVIAEVGINHNGDMSVAKQLIDMAVDTGCDAVKFQKRTIDLVYTAEVLDASRESPWGNTQRDQKQGLEFTLEQYQEIDRYCRDKGILWSASAWDIPSLEFTEAVASKGRLTLVSTGMATIEIIDEVVGIFKSAGTPFVLLHTVSTYPSPESDLNLSMIHTLLERYKVPVGYSGHEPSVSPSIVAAVLGATVIERHITLDRSMYGSDQAASLEESGLRQLVSTLRKIPTMLGTGEQAWAPGEKAVAEKLRYWETPSE